VNDVADVREWGIAGKQRRECGWPSEWRIDRNYDTRRNSRVKAYRSEYRCRARVFDKFGTQVAPPGFSGELKIRERRARQSA
jgi:hypothetical protein